MPKYCCGENSIICLYALNGDGICYLWKINSICFDSKRLNLTFNFCSFCWVRREINNVAYCLTRFASLHNLSLLCCNHSSLSSSGLEAELSDICSISDFWMKTHLAKKTNAQIYIEAFYIIWSCTNLVATKYLIWIGPLQHSLVHFQTKSIHICDYQIHTMSRV